MRTVSVMGSRGSRGGGGIRRGSATAALDLNCDLGEGESPVRTRALMQVITSANVACGGHAGDVRSMQRCVRLALQYSVRLGAHPGLADGFGRGEVRLGPEALELLVVQQVSSLVTVAQGLGAELHHVKLHGSLYHATESDPLLARALVRTMQRWFPRVCLYALAGGRLVCRAREAGVPAWEEGFVDRGYRDDGTLVPRGSPGAVISDVREARRRLREVREGLGVESVSGRRLKLWPQTWCVHSDTPGAVRIARAAAAAAGSGS
jgi:5-oxoprolinase (ATP-hydrolysing) subunit A